MIHNDKLVENVQIAYIGGGSRGWARGLMSDLAVEESMSGTVKLYDIDYEAAKANEIIGNKLMSQHSDLMKNQWKYVAVQSLEKALNGANFVVISILPGTFDEMDSDVHTPEKYGIYQPVGDTVGPGGIVRSMRLIPMYVEIAQAIERFCPEAWIINYTNPMSICVRTLYEVFPRIKAFGCCHEVFGTQKLLAKMVEDDKNISGVKREDIKVNVFGINHFTWLDKAQYRGEDLLPVYEKFINKYYDEGFELDEKGHWMNSVFACANRVKFDLFKRYGLIAAAGDRHLAEFCPAWYLKTPEIVKSWKFNMTTVGFRKQQLKERLQQTHNLLNDVEKTEISITGEEGVGQMKALLGLGGLITNINIPNAGQIPTLPIGAVVESNAIFDNNSITPVFAGCIPSDVNILILRHSVNQELVLKGTLNKDKNEILKAFCNDPLVNIDINSAKKLLNEMMKNTAKYLEGWEI